MARTWLEHHARRLWLCGGVAIGIERDREPCIEEPRLRLATRDSSKPLLLPTAREQQCLVRRSWSCGSVDLYTTPRWNVVKRSRDRGLAKARRLHDRASRPPVEPNPRSHCGAWVRGPIVTPTVKLSCASLRTAHNTSAQPRARVGRSGSVLVSVLVSRHCLEQRRRIQHPPPNIGFAELKRTP